MRGQIQSHFLQVRGFGMFFSFLVLVLFMIILFWIFKSGKFGNEKPKDILKKRLAKGEITKKEYEDILKEIEK